MFTGLACTETLQICHMRTLGTCDSCHMLLQQQVGADLVAQGFALLCVAA